MDAADAPTMEEDSTWSVALARFRAVFANAPESEFAALVRDTAECYNMKEEEVVQDLAEEPLERSVRHQIAEGWEHAPKDSDPMKRLVKKSFDMAIAENNLKKNVSFVFQVRSEKQTFDTTPAILDKRSLIDGTIRDHGDQPCEDPRITPDPSANFTFKETALSRVAYEYAPGRLDEFHSAVHRAASHHGVAMERIVLVLTTPGMFWCTPEDEHAMDTRGSKHVMIREDSGEYVVAIVSPLYAVPV